MIQIERAPNLKAKLALLCFVTLFLNLPALATNKKTVAVNLFESHRPLQILKIFPPFEIVKHDLDIKISFPISVSVQNGKICLVKISSSKTVIAQSHSFILKGIASQTIALTANSLTDKRRYHGDIILSTDKGRSLNIVNRVPLDNYIKDVVASESPAGAHPEMLKAQAILCQTLIYRLSPSSIIGDSTKIQCYLGSTLERPAINEAVNSVAGQLLCYKGNPIKVYYHSTCAGGTSDGSIYFHLSPGSIPYLAPVPCRYCHLSPFWKTTQNQISRRSFTQTFGSELPNIIEKDYTKRPLSVKLANGQVITGYDFWMKLGQNFGWDKCPGTRYTLKQDRTGNIIVESTGGGHGVGLCQWGANELAKQGKTYKQILEYYFPGSEVR